ncbi:Electron transfer flavoprotein subunit alpha [Propionispora sp. 2/2-37]|uniref:electron transfer flavoprotein subunit alpha/FixB family protein n=1 Tax=Propionispora sp. 2/2-37 TaxID=1677858 RepID=UPI0006BB9083|nr:electron transfer flavoprotein subunit alpha/FixB family protein [Propionispora sp. 2/2-37]CUH96897.1 Electron transfer flavoprotein subunit alpha [Propionispora sp. 2/2-37]
MKEKKQDSGLWVFIEQINGKANPVGCELLGQARKLAMIMRQQICAVVLGQDVKHLAAGLIASGADIVYLIEGREYQCYSTDAYSTALAFLLINKKPSVVLFGSTYIGRDLAPRLACRLKTGLIADCTDFTFDPVRQIVVWRRPAFEGNVVADIVCPVRRPQMATVRPHIFPLPKQDFSRQGGIIQLKGQPQFGHFRTKINQVIPQENNDSCSLEDAAIIVAGGRGMGNRANFYLLERLAAALGGVVGASRGVVEIGWRKAQEQIGLSGRIVKPRLYFACGISGAFHHLAGITSAEIIVAINTDPDAPIFNIADYGIVGDIEVIIPAILAEIEANTADRR